MQDNQESPELQDPATPPYLGSPVAVRRNVDDDLEETCRIYFESADKKRYSNKGAANGYRLFVKHRARMIKKQDETGLTYANVRDWSELRESERLKYNQEADKIHERLIVAKHNLGESDESQEYSEKDESDHADKTRKDVVAEDELAQEADQL